jgi:hypothetical protein
MPRLSLHLKLLPMAAALLLACVASAQKPIDILVAKIRKEAGIEFTYKVRHDKTSGPWNCLVLTLIPKNTGVDKAIAIGILKKGKQWTVVDYVLGTYMGGVLDGLKKRHPQVPKSIYPAKL